MKAKYAIGDDCSHWQVVEGVSEVLPNVCVAVFSEAFIIEAIHLSNLSTFMVTSQNCQSVFIANFKTDKQCYSFDRIIASVHIVTHE